MELDMHYYAVYSLARTAGLKREAAQTIAYSSQYVDDSTAEHELRLRDGSKIYPTITAHHPVGRQNSERSYQRAVWVPFHFLPGCEGQGLQEKSICTADSTVANQMLENHISRKNCSYILELLGIAAHVYADTFSHYGFSGVASRLNLVEEKEIQIINDSPAVLDLANKAQDFFAKQGRYGGATTVISSGKDYISNLLSITKLPVVANLINRIIPFLKKLLQPTKKKLGALGHGAVYIYPDTPYLKWNLKYEEQLDHPARTEERNNPTSYLTACEKLYNLFATFKSNNPDYADETTQKDFKEIQPALKRIITAENSLAKRCQLWQQEASSGNLYNSNENIPPYSDREWEEQKKSFSRVDMSDVARLPLYRFYQAAAYHRHFVLNDLLPAHNLQLIN